MPALGVLMGLAPSLATRAVAVDCGYFTQFCTRVHCKCGDTVIANYTLESASEDNPHVVNGVLDCSASPATFGLKVRSSKCPFPSTAWSCTGSPKTCTGGPNAGQSCGIDGDCRPANAWTCNAGTCSGGPNDGQDCVDTSECQVATCTNNQCTAGTEAGAPCGVVFDGGGVTIKGADAVGEIGLLLDGTFGATAQNVKVTEWYRGVQLINNARRNTVRDIEAFENGDAGIDNQFYGVDVRLGASSNVFRNLDVHHNGDEGIHISSGSHRNDVRHSTFASNGEVTGTKGEQIYLLDVDRTTIIENEAAGLLTLRVKNATNSNIRRNALTGPVEIIGSSTSNLLLNNTVNGRVRITYDPEHPTATPSLNTIQVTNETDVIKVNGLSCVVFERSFGNIIDVPRDQLEDCDFFTQTIGTCDGGSSCNVNGDCRCWGVCPNTAIKCSQNSTCNTCTGGVCQISGQSCTSSGNCPTCDRSDDTGTCGGGSGPALGGDACSLATDCGCHPTAQFPCLGGHCSGGPANGQSCGDASACNRNVFVYCGTAPDAADFTPSTPRAEQSIDLVAGSSCPP